MTKETQPTRTHGNDERMSVAHYIMTIKYYIRFVKNVAGTSSPNPLQFPDFSDLKWHRKNLSLCLAQPDGNVYKPMVQYQFPKVQLKKITLSYKVYSFCLDK